MPEKSEACYTLLMVPDASFYQSLPAKRMAAGCLFFNDAGQVLLVKPTYKPTWEIPGGIVEKDESPKQCCRREVNEEIGIQQEIGRLLVIDYNAQVGEKTESLQFIFYGGVLSPIDIGSIRLKQDELSAYGFFDEQNLPSEMTNPLRNRILRALSQVDQGDGIYLENQEPK